MLWKRNSAVVFLIGGIKMYGFQIDMKKTGAKIKALCRERNLTVKDIQKELYIGAFQSVYDWFSGKTLPSVDNLYRLSKLLKVQMEDMIEIAFNPIIDIQLREQGNKTYLRVYYEKLIKCA